MKLFPRALLLLLLVPIVGCHEQGEPDRPRLIPAARLIDIEIDSAILSRKIPVRLIVPAAPAPNAPVVYLLHGAGASFREWSNHSDIATLAASNVILVMPDSADSYYINDARGFRYEDFFFKELVPRIHQQLPYASRDRSRTAIVGISRGGYGAAVYGFHHPEFFSFVGALSGAFDLAERASSVGALRLNPARMAASSAPRAAPFAPPTTLFSCLNPPKPPPGHSSTSPAENYAGTGAHQPEFRSAPAPALLRL